MEGTDFDEIGFFRALARARDQGTVRALLIGRRALVIDLIATKQIKPRAKDLEDVALLETLRRRQT